MSRVGLFTRMAGGGGEEMARINRIRLFCIACFAWRFRGLLIYLGIFSRESKSIQRKCNKPKISHENRRRRRKFKMGNVFKIFNVAKFSEALFLLRPHGWAECVFVGRALIVGHYFRCGYFDRGGRGPAMTIVMMRLRAVSACRH